MDDKKITITTRSIEKITVRVRSIRSALVELETEKPRALTAGDDREKEISPIRECPDDV